MRAWPCPSNAVGQQDQVVLVEHRILDQRPDLLMNVRLDPYLPLRLAFVSELKAIVDTRRGRWTTLDDGPELEHFDVDVAAAPETLRRGFETRAESIEHFFLALGIDRKIAI